MEWISHLSSIVSRRDIHYKFNRWTLDTGNSMMSFVPPISSFCLFVMVTSLSISTAVCLLFSLGFSVKHPLIHSFIMLQVSICRRHENNNTPDACLPLVGLFGVTAARGGHCFCQCKLWMPYFDPSLALRSRIRE